MTLTIAIPTYNRALALGRVLERLAPQLTSRCVVLVLDNASSEPVEPIVGASGIAPAVVRVVRHRVNIGAHANIHRAVELCDTAWIWILGDDDLPTTDAIERILTTIDAEPDATFVNFTTTRIVRDARRPVTLRSTGLAEFVEVLDLPNNVNFMSASVWRHEAMLPSLRLAYHYAYSMSWVFAFLLPACASGATIVLHASPIIDEMTLADEGERWSHVNLVMGYPTVLEAPMPTAVRRRLARKVLAAFGPEQVVAYLLGGLHAGPTAEARWAHDIVAGRLRPYLGWFQRARLSAYGALFLAPRLGWRIVRSCMNLSVAMGIKGVRVADVDSRSQPGARL